MDEADFDRWWRGYPNKNHKIAALKAWRKINPSPATIEKMMADLPRWKAIDPQYVPHGSSYIHGKRWLDEISGASEVGRVDDGRVNRAGASNGAAVRNLIAARDEVERLTPEQRRANVAKLRAIAESIGRRI